MANTKKQTPNEFDKTETTTSTQTSAANARSASSGKDQASSAANQGGGLRSVSGSGGSATGTATARSFYDQAKETAGQAYDAAAEKATNKLEEQKTNLSGGLSSVADSVRKVSENLRGPDVQDGISKFAAEYSELAAKKIEGIASYFDRKSVNEMYRDLEGFARRNPAVFVGGAFALGLIAARFLKSGSGSRSIGGSQRRGEITAGEIGSSPS